MLVEKTELLWCGECVLMFVDCAVRTGLKYFGNRKIPIYNPSTDTMEDTPFEQLDKECIESHTRHFLKWCVVFPVAMVPVGFPVSVPVVEELAFEDYLCI